MKTQRIVTSVLVSIALFGAALAQSTGPVLLAADPKPIISDNDGQPQLNPAPGQPSQNQSANPPASQSTNDKSVFGLSIAQATLLGAALVGFVLLAFFIRWMTTPSDPAADEPQT